MNQELQRLGKPPSDDPAGALFGLVSDFDSAISKHTDGQPEYESFMQTVNGLAEGFMAMVKQTKPAFMAVERTNKQTTFGTSASTLVGAVTVKQLLEKPAEKFYLDDMRSHIDS